MEPKRASAATPWIADKKSLGGGCAQGQAEVRPAGSTGPTHHMPSRHGVGCLFESEEEFAMGQIPAAGSLPPSLSPMG